MIQVDIDLSDPVQCKRFIYWATENGIQWEPYAYGHKVSVLFNDEFELLRWA